MSDDRREGAPLSEEERARLALEQLKQVHAGDLAAEMMVSLVSFAYQKLGLTEHTAPVRDLDDAHLAIELLRALLEVTEHEAAMPAVGDLRATLAQLQLGFAQAVQLTAAPAPPAEAPAAQEPAGEPAAAGREPVAEDRAPAQAGTSAEEPVGEERAGEPATKKPTARKPAAKQPTARKPAAKQPTARKPAAKKSRRKPAAGD